jgi:hypothetical protein
MLPSLRGTQLQEIYPCRSLVGCSLIHVAPLKVGCPRQASSPLLLFVRCNGGEKNLRETDNKDVSEMEEHMHLLAAYCAPRASPAAPLKDLGRACLEWKALPRGHLLHAMRSAIAGCSAALWGEQHILLQPAVAVSSEGFNKLSLLAATLAHLGVLSQLVGVHWQLLLVLPHDKHGVCQVRELLPVVAHICGLQVRVDLAESPFLGHGAMRAIVGEKRDMKARPTSQLITVLSLSLAFILVRHVSVGKTLPAGAPRPPYFWPTQTIAMLTMCFVPRLIKTV